MIIKKTLDNGIRIVMEKIPSVKSVSVGIWVKAGSVDENKKIAGISHLIEHMMFKGTDTRSAKKIAEDVDRIGGQINAFTGKEATCYYIKTLESNIDKGCDIITDMFINSKFDEEELEREKSVIFEEIKMIEDSPEDDAHENLQEILFRGSALESPIIGTYSSLESITRDTILEYIDEEYTADSIVISVAGSFDEDLICNIFNERLEGIKNTKSKKILPVKNYVPDYKVKKKDVEQSHICLGTKSVAHEDELYYPMLILNSIMGGSMSSRLFQNIREQKGLAYTVYSSIHSYQTDGMYYIYAGVSHDKVDEAVDAICIELKDLAKKGITEDELYIAKEQLKSNYVFSQENVNNRMYSLGKNTLLRSRLLTPSEVIEKINNVTMDDIKKASEIITDITKYSGVIVSDRQFDIKGMLKGLS
ncbi:MAG: insulinase family protein [Clostridiales bacterium]|nr:insulinase family protein [Clostridiales bacterium]